MQTKGIVIRTSGKTATVRIRKSSACGHDCGECRVCNNPEIEIDVVNTAGAKENDTVLVGADTQGVLWNAFLLYMLPVIGAFAVYIVSQVISAGTYMTVLAVLVWLAAWFIFMRYKSKNITIKSCILEVVHEKT